MQVKRGNQVVIVEECNNIFCSAGCFREYKRKFGARGDPKMTKKMGRRWVRLRRAGSASLGSAVCGATMSTDSGL